MAARLIALFASIDVSRAARTRARKLDADQVQANLRDPKRHDELLNPDHLDIEKPGLGLFYCLECDRHFPSQADREVHQRSKLHKRIAKRMQDEKAYTVEESLWAAGIGVDNKQRPSEQQQQQQQQEHATAGQDQSSTQAEQSGDKRTAMSKDGTMALTEA